MIRGMTGFGRTQGQAPWGAWSWEARSVNGKSLDVRVSTPPGFDAVEFEARKRAKERFQRGSLQVQLRIDFAREAEGVIVARRELNRLIRLARQSGLGTPTLEGLLAAPGLLRAGSRLPPSADEAIGQQVLAGLDRAFDALQAARADEGDTLLKLFQSLLDQIAMDVVRAGDLAALQPALVRDRLQARLVELVGKQGSVDADRIAQEAGLLATRADIREELDRLGAHVETARRLLTAPDAAGRKLDFLCQELNREANTLCSKSASLELTNVGLSLKSAIDQFREQVQNVE